MPFHKTFEPVFACYFFGDWKSIGDFIVAANWKASLLTSSQVNKRDSTSFYSRAQSLTEWLDKGPNMSQRNRIV